MSRRPIILMASVLLALPFGSVRAQGLNAEGVPGVIPGMPGMSGTGLFPGELNSFGGLSGLSQAQPNFPDMAAGANSLNRNCMPKEQNFACGECETNLQSQFNDLVADITGAPADGDHWGGALHGKRSIRPGVTLEGTLAKIRDLLKSNNQDGDGGLNFIVIGESESLQPSAVRDGKMYPRVALKSPNSELWVTFSTDPTNAAYSTLEIMRWNGKKAKYEFMELDFDPKQRHMDGTGEKCLSCHKEPDPRPNWDTYRAWAGVVPSRDDMLEMGDKKGGLTGLFSKPKLGADGRAYVSFLEQVVEAKEKEPQSRLAMLDLPIDDRVQFSGRNPRVSSLPPRAQLEAIKKQTENEGFYRIPHFPYKDKMRTQNFDVKTAAYTGPSQAAFDQMSGQNFCRISTRLKENPNYDKFKYFLAGVANRCVYDDAPSWVPESMQQTSLAYFTENPRVRLRNLHLAGSLPSSIGDFSQLMREITNDTNQNHSMANEFKFKRHQRFLESYLKTVESRKSSEVAREAEEFARTIKAPVRSGFHAIGDYGGVTGVPEGNALQISQIRAVLEPLGVDVTQWSMMRGDDPNYNSLAFSDQFPLLFQQAAIREVLQEARVQSLSTGQTTCEYLRTKSVQALVTRMPQVAPPSANDFNVDQWCRDRLSAEAGGTGIEISEQMKGLFAITKKLAVERAQALTVQCLSCHGKNGFLPFPGMNELTDVRVFPNDAPGPWTDSAWEKFEAYLLSPVVASSPVLLPGYRGSHFIDKLILGRMPPGGWPHGGTHEEKKREDDERRKFLADYISMTIVTDPEANRVTGFCRSLVGGEGSKQAPASSSEDSSPTGVIQR